MTCLVPINDDLDYTLRTRIKELVNEIRDLRRSAKSRVKRRLYTFKHADVMTTDKLKNDILFDFDQTMGEIMQKTYEIDGKLLQLGNTVSLDDLEKGAPEIKFCEGYTKCFSDMYQVYHEFSGQMQ